MKQPHNPLDVIDAFIALTVGRWEIEYPDRPQPDVAIVTDMVLARIRDDQLWDITVALVQDRVGNALWEVSR